MVLAGALAGCITPSVPELQAHPPQAWANLPPAAAPAQLGAWWKVLHDPVLDRLVDEALQGNLDLAQAGRRLQREKILSERSGAHFLPVFSAGARTLQDLATADDYLQASVDMTWELGLFGAAQSTRLAAQADLDSAQAREQGARVALVAGVVRAYLELKTANYQAGLFADMQALDQRSAELASVRARAHIAEPGEAMEISLRWAQARAACAQAQEAADAAALALAVLLGRESPDPAWGQMAAEPAMAEFTLTQVPADLLRTRPDIQLAESGVLSAAGALGLSRSALYPRFALTGSLSYLYNLTHGYHVAGNDTPAVGPLIDIPLWDWRLRRAQVSADEQALDAAVLGYRKAVLDGVAEAQTALSALRHSRDKVQAYTDALAGRQTALGAQKILAGQGLSSGFDAIADQRAVLEARIELASATALQNQAFVALYRALGGAPLPVPEVDQQ